MTKEEAGRQYNIPIEVLDLYESWGLCGEVRKVMGAWQYDDRDLERLGMIMTLHDIGFDNRQVEVYMRLYLQGEETEAERMRMLNWKRGLALDEIHFKEKQLERLDYLRHEIKKARNNRCLQVTKDEAEKSTNIEKEKLK